MPLLPREPAIFPDNLLEHAAESTDSSRRWWVLHSRPRAEKALARKLLGHCLPYYLALFERKTRTSGRLLRSYLPLFPGYVFLHGDDQGRLQAVQTNLVVRVLQVHDQPQLQADLKRVHDLLTAGLPVWPAARLQPGTRVAIVSGPLTGLEGRILHWGKRCTFFVEVQFLQRGVSVELDGSMVQPLTEPRSANIAGAAG